MRRSVAPDTSTEKNWLGMRTSEAATAAVTMAWWSSMCTNTSWAE